jgi:hypothetical protein
MRPLSILTTALLLTAGLSAVATPATAQDPFCEVRDASPEPLQSIWSEDQRGCYTYAEPWQCVGGNGYPVEYRVGPVHAVIYVCTPPPGTIPDIW